MLETTFRAVGKKNLGESYASLKKILYILKGCVSPTLEIAYESNPDASGKSGRLGRKCEWFNSAAKGPHSDTNLIFIRSCALKGEKRVAIKGSSTQTS